MAVAGSSRCWFAGFCGALGAIQVGNEEAAVGQKRTHLIVYDAVDSQSGSSDTSRKSERRRSKAQREN